jgi:hypothetical protein
MIGFAPGSLWRKYDSYQGMPSGMPEVLPNECAFRRWVWALEFHYEPLALTLFGLGVFVCGSYVRSYFGRCFRRHLCGHFLLVEKSERSTVTQFPESIQEKDGRESE